MIFRIITCVLLVFFVFIIAVKSEVQKPSYGNVILGHYPSPNIEWTAAGSPTRANKFKAKNIKLMAMLKDVFTKIEDHGTDKRQFDDYGHLRFGKRGEYDDYGHLRFGRGFDGENTAS